MANEFRIPEVRGEQTDVVIVGAGAAGIATARGLRAVGRDVTISRPETG
jgi:cation diffusion facilitator CzcD-associated flavoprotein CzcO